MLKKLAAISLTAGALVLMAPAVASAATVVPTASDSYADTPRVSVDDPVINSCGASTIEFAAGYYQPSEVLGVSVSGANAADAAVSGNTAAADGSLVVSFRPPAGGEGTYAITFDRSQGAAGATAQGASSYTARVTVSGGAVVGSSCHHDPAAAGTELALTGDGLELALTGGSVSPWLLGAGAAALIGGGALVATGIVRRKRA
ncbi:hypothetical protein MRBLWO14_000573 [Microbacterium sp. LWO14-1.2]|uniref:hypothetical protein n=1 Tax=Microbacterium sp. LWO14-1.2 TaxID=3135263 RepID=UPI003139AEE6